MLKSPCVGVCEYEERSAEEKDSERICRGCGRSSEEITEWSKATEDRQKEIIQLARKRKREWRRPLL